MSLQHVLVSIALFIGLAGCAGDPSQKKEKDQQMANTDSKNQTNDQQQQEDTSSTGQFGAAIDEQGIMKFADVKQQLKDTSATRAKLSGKVASVCQKKGCWMKVALDESKDTVMVRFKDYGFFVPKNAAGKHVVMDGKAHIDTMSVKKRRHYARDAGMSKEEVQKINEPKEKMAYQASGVILKEDEE
jgi:flagellar motor protein MotB